MWNLECLVSSGAHTSESAFFSVSCVSARVVCRCVCGRSCVRAREHAWWCVRLSVPLCVRMYSCGVVRVHAWARAVLCTLGQAWIALILFCGVARVSGPLRGGERTLPPPDTAPVRAFVLIRRRRRGRQ